MFEHYKIVNEIINIVSNRDNTLNEGEIYLTLDSLVSEPYRQGELAAYQHVNNVILDNNKELR